MTNQPCFTPPPQGEDWKGPTVEEGVTTLGCAIYSPGLSWPAGLLNSQKSRVCDSFVTNRDRNESTLSAENSLINLVRRRLAN